MNFNPRSHATLTRVFATTAAGLGVLALAACGPTPHAAPGASSSPPSTPAAHTASQHPSKTAPTKGANDSNVTPGDSDVPGNSGDDNVVNPCQTEGLKLSTFRYDSDDKSILARLNYKNISGSSCSLNGFPGVSRMQAEDGGQLGPAAARKAIGAYSPVTVKPGGYAYSFVTIPDADALSNAECQPTPAAGLRIFPPDNTDATFLDMEGDACATDAGRMTVYPVSLDPNAVPSE